jgi:hypothetical protein
MPKPSTALTSAATTDYKPIVIKGPEDMKGAAEVLSRLNTILDTLTEEKEKLTKPLNEALKEIRGRYKPAETKLEAAIAQVRGEMSRYQTKVLQEARAAEAEAAKKLRSGDVSLEEAVSLAAQGSQGVAGKIAVGSGGSVAFRVDKVLRVVDVSKVPRTYMIVDEKKVREALLQGKKVAGCVLEEVSVPVNKR